MKPKTKALLAAFVINFSCWYATAQNVALKLDNVTVKEAMTKLKDGSGYSFVYKVGDIDTSRKVNVDATQLPQAVKQILDGQNVVYEISGKNIVVHPAPAQTKADPAATHLVTGEVLEADGEPVIGASVKEAGTNNLVVTDLDGHFDIRVPRNAVLEVSYIGFKPVKVNVGDKDNLSISLDIDRQVLDEVVVVGYGSTSRKNLTTSISTVKTDDIQKSAVSNVNQLLMGRAAGLNANMSSTQPGGAVNISIRGGGNPVYVVDGVIMPNDAFEVGNGSTSLPSSINRAGMAGLNPSDIESVEILKDASAAIYGVDAANGVILITTKKGSNGSPTITYEGSVSMQKHYKYLEVLNSQEYMNMVNLFSKEKYLYTNNHYPYGNVAYDGKWSPIFTSQQILDAHTTDWLDKVMRTGFVTNHNITISGGTDKFKYYLGANYYKEDATVYNSDMERYTIRTSIESQLTSRLKLNAIINLNQNNYTNSTIGGDPGNTADQGAGVLYGAIYYPPYYDVYDENGDYMIFGRTPNPISMQEISDKSKTNGSYMNFSANYDIIPGMFSAKVIYGLNKENNSRDAYIPSDIYYALQRKSRGVLGQGHRQYSTIEGMLNFNHTFWKVFDMNVVAGMGRYLNEGNGISVSYENANDHLSSDDISMADGPYYPSSYKWKNERRSQFARGTFTLFDRYIVSATLRRDGTDKFFSGKKYSLFPSVSVAWKLYEEKFLRDITWVNMLKLRASYGETGSDNLGSSLYGTITTTREDVQFNHNTVSYINYILSGADYPDVTWEKTTMKNIGIDYSLFNDRVYGAIDLFRNDITNMLGSANTELLGMFGKRPINGAHFKRTGVDFSVNTVNINTSDFRWTSLLTLSHYNSTWVERMPNYDYKDYQKRKNEPTAAFYYYKTSGNIALDLSNMPESQRSLGSAACKPGYPIIVDRNGDGKIDASDAYMDDATPKVTFGFGNTFVWRNWDLDIFLYGNLGVKKTNMAYSYSSSSNNLSNGVNTHNYGKYAYYIWNSQTNPTGRFPGIAYELSGVQLPGNLGVDYLREDASFVRVRNITLGYNFTRKQLAWARGAIKDIRLYLDCQNPFTFTCFKGYDPEIDNSAARLNGGQYPQIRVYTFGAKFVF